MKKAFDQTVRDLKRGVNKKVLKVPSIEQKVLDATSNEAWGPHGSVLADIAQATKNYHEYQMIMAVIWKRINDTGKNWRHVYKALTVLEYLVAHGSERVIDDIREHGYQISTLSDFQYIDSSGRDQGNNIRKKSQSLVVLVNDKDRLQEVRQKAAANRDKYRNTAVGAMYRPGSGKYGEKYDDDRYGESDRYGRYGEDRSSRGRSQSIGDYSYGSRSRSADGDRYGRNEDDEQHSSRGSGARADEQSHDGRLDRKYSEQSLGAPPSYEDAVSAGHSPTYCDRDHESSVSYAPKASSPTAVPGPVGPGSPSVAPVSPPPSLAHPTGQDSNNVEECGFDEFDPRGASLAAPNTSHAPAASAVEVDLLGSLYESFSSNALALVATSTEDDSSVFVNSVSTSAAAPLASAANDQPFDDDPFGDGPFKAIISSADTAPNFEAAPQNAFGVEPTTDTYLQSSGIEDIDILADILPPTTAPSSSINPQDGYNAPPQPVSHGGFALQTNHQPPPPQFGLPFHQANLSFYGNYRAQSVSGGVPPVFGGPVLQQNSLSQPLHMGSWVPKAQPSSSSSSIGPTSSTTAASTGPVYSQPSKEKFEMKSSVWADTLSRGLVDLNISGNKTNPLADIGVDFDAINRKERRMEKSPSTASSTAAATPMSTVTMGKAMGSGSGLGRAGASALVGMGGYGAGQPMGRGMGPGMDMNMGTGQGFNMQQQSGFRPMPGNPYYGQQQPYGGGGYR